MSESSLNFDEGSRKRSDPAHFECLEREIHVSFVNAAKMGVKCCIEGGKGDSVMMPGEAVDGGIGSGASGVVCDCVREGDVNVVKNGCSSFELGVLATGFEGLVKPRVKHGEEGGIASGVGGLEIDGSIGVHQGVVISLCSE